MLPSPTPSLLLFFSSFFPFVFLSLPFFKLDSVPLYRSVSVPYKWRVLVLVVVVNWEGHGHKEEGATSMPTAVRRALKLLQEEEDADLRVQAARNIRHLTKASHGCHR